MVRLAVISFLFLSIGCEEQITGPSVEERLAIESVAKWYQYYKSQNRGKAPKDEAAFATFIDKQLEGRSGEVETAEEILTSKRDGEKYVVLYGADAGKSKNMDKNVALYEQVGVGGKKLVAFEAAWAKEVDEAELQSLLAGQE